MAWNKDVPAAGIQARYLDDGVRTNNAALEDALGRDHEFPGTMSSTAGMHNVVQLIDQAGDEAAHATAIKLWNNAGALKSIAPGGAAKTVGYQGELNAPAGTVMLFGQNSAPTGWTRKADWQDNAMFCYAASGDISSGGSVNPQSTHTHTGPSHTHTGPSHTHTGPSHTHTGPSHTHTGPSHAHAASGLTVNTYHRHNSGAVVGGGGLTPDAGFGYYTDYQGGASTAVAGSTAAEGTGATGAAGNGATGAEGTGATGAGGTGATSASGTGTSGGNSTPYFQELIVCTKN